MDLLFKNKQSVSQMLVKTQQKKHLAFLEVLYFYERGREDLNSRPCCSIGKNNFESLRYTQFVAT